MYWQLSNIDYAEELEHRMIGEGSVVCVGCG
jgi:hypothetical protein